MTQSTKNSSPCPMAHDGELEEILTYYRSQSDPANQENLVSMLREIQELYEYIPKEVLPLIAEHFQIKENLLHQIIRLYPSLKSAPYRHRIIVCSGERCRNKNSASVLAAVKEAVSAEPGRFELVTQNCLKKCVSGPNMRIDDTLYPGVKPEDVKEILSQLSDTL